VRGFSPAGEAYKAEIDVDEMITRIYEVDVHFKEGETRVEAIKVEDIPAKVELSLFPDPRADLIKEVSRNIQFRNISLREITEYVAHVIDFLVESQKATLKQLIYHRYKLALVIKDKIQSLLDEYAHAHFETFRNEKKLGICPSFVFPSTVEIFLHEETGYNKHFYERAYLMDSEEKIVASRLDSLENVRWWLRNIERSGFYLQGYRKGRFFPDFIVKTKKNNYFIIEYKGEDLLDTADTRYKEEVGEIWQSLAPENYFFRLISKDKVDEMLEFISNR
jgi:type III restriction enzyme